MKGFRGFVITLGVVLTMMAFFPGISAFADGGGSHDDPQTTASEAASANDEPTMKSFVLHAKRHMDEAVAGGRATLSAFNRQMRTQEAWNSDSVYLITIGKSGGSVINHGIYTKDLYGDSISGLQTVGELLAKLGEVAPGEAACVQYGDMDRWSCAVQYDTINQEIKGVLIGGFDHAKDDPAITPPDCPDYKPAVTAQQVSESGENEDLKAFVKEAIKRIDDLIAQAPAGSQRFQDAISKAACLGRGHWKSGPIYLFIMAKLPTGIPVVILNGNNPEFTGNPFVNIFDEDDVDVGAEILKVAGEHGESDFVKYKWDNPTIEEDDVDMEGRSPGRSPKTSYVEGVTFSSRPGVVFIFGSGTYEPFEPDGGGEMDMDSDGDDGCAIAGTNNKLGNTVLNFLLIVFSLCLAFWWKDRSKG